MEAAQGVCMEMQMEEVALISRDTKSQKFEQIR